MLTYQITIDAKIYNQHRFRRSKQTMENPYSSRQPYGAAQKAAGILARSTASNGPNASLFQSYRRQNNSTQNPFQTYGNQWRGSYQTKNKTPKLRAPKTPHRRVLNGVTYVIRKGSITDFKTTNCGAIVNAANEQALGGGGVDGAISKAGGAPLLKVRKALPIIWENIRVRTGDARATLAGNLMDEGIKYVIHAVGPDLNNEEHNLEMLKSAYLSSVDEAYMKNVQNIAFPIISGGVFRGKYPLETIIKTAFEALVGNEDELKCITFYGFTDEEVRLLCTELDSISVRS